MRKYTNTKKRKIKFLARTIYRMLTIEEKTNKKDKHKNALTVQKLIDELCKIEDRQREVYIRSNNFLFLPAHDVIDMSDNLIGICSGETLVSREDAMTSLDDIIANLSKEDMAEIEEEFQKIEEEIKEEFPNWQCPKTIEGLSEEDMQALLKDNREDFIDE